MLLTRIYPLSYCIPAPKTLLTSPDAPYIINRKVNASKFASLFLTKPDNAIYTNTLIAHNSLTPTPTPTMSAILDWGFFFPKASPFRTDLGPDFLLNRLQMPKLNPNPRAVYFYTPKLRVPRVKLSTKKIVTQSIKGLPKFTPTAASPQYQLHHPVSHYVLKRRKRLIFKKPLRIFNFATLKNTLLRQALPKSLAPTAPNFYNIAPTATPVKKGLTLEKGKFLPRITVVRFTPGLRHQWLNLRTDYAKMVGLKLNSQTKLTKFVMLQKTTTGFALIKTLALSAAFLLKQASLFTNPALTTTWAFTAAKTQLWNLNNNPLTNLYTQIYPGDVLALTPTIHTPYTLTKHKIWLAKRYWRRFKYLQANTSYVSTPSYLEVDELTASVILLFTPTKLSQIDPMLWTTRPFLTHRLLNWKRIT